MSQIASGSIHKFLTGETVTGDDTQVPTNLNIAFELLRLAINDNYQRISNVLEAVTGTGGGVFRSKTQVFIATAGQTVFNLTEGSYTMGNDRLQVYVSGVKQYLDSGDFSETSATAFTLSEGVPATTKVEAVWIEGILGSATDPIIHASRHAANGADPINISTLAGYSDLIASTPRATTAPLNFYVNWATGSDTNDGSLATPFKTIQKAVNSVPQIVNHIVNINVADNTYTDNVVIKGFTGSETLYLTGNVSTPANVITPSVTVASTSISVVVRGFTANTISRTAFLATGCSYVEFSNNMSLFPSSYYGISANASTVYAAANTINNKARAFSSIFGANLTSYGNSGTGNTYVFYAEIGGILGYNSGSVPTGTTFSFSDTGGSVTAGVLNPWGDNTQASRSRVYYANGSNQNVVGSTTTKILFQALGVDNLSEFSSSKFTAKAAGTYFVSGQLTFFSGMTTTVDFNINIFKNGAVYRVIKADNGSTKTAPSIPFSCVVDLIAGDYIEIYITTSTSTVLASPTTTIDIVRIA